MPVSRQASSGFTRTATSPHNERMLKISSAVSYPLYNVAATRLIEHHAASGLPPQTLMQRAGLSVARLTLALAPHAQRIWIACGPGNNGGDGFEAALHLHQWGKHVVVTWTGPPAGKAKLPPDAHASRERALAAGVPMGNGVPSTFDVCIDALLGIGATLDSTRPANALMQQWLEAMHDSQALSLAVDVPTGLDADTGMTTFRNATGKIARSSVFTSAPGIFTLSLLTLKPGLFTASGRDTAGEIWFDDLGPHSDSKSFPEPCAWLMGADGANLSRRTLPSSHASHKGSFGDVAVLGGESSDTTHMTGAALLAGSAALHAGAGRVFVSLLGNASGMTVNPQQPELMFRVPEALDMAHQVVVCGCGSGEAVKAILEKVLMTAKRVVLDADALNAIAANTPFQRQLASRPDRGCSTVLTPHPLEAARLLGVTTAAVQADRLTAAEQLAKRFRCVVVLKGSGTVITGPGKLPMINSTGNALLATAGTGDVLAGMLGAYLAQGMNDFEAACSAVFFHGHKADAWYRDQPLRPLTALGVAQANDAV
ncbi:MAG: carbohydrate kinase, YjeF related protein [Polaromonas sp.]|nr:carbohydrate kinase, YjeF related protein [Polaromonas sp.]